ncbi:MAG: O-succinylhomoserine sulfhydrylase [Nitrosomonas sp.]|uniref:O-succinylhomoserine sulfhydrylase n=1 Tax=Nitrosomonas sp. TaxID=42353 RepID=UPI00271A3009|nr:O-succinylhomoserine sulfhydrylase [Nitrosomonas sp.]MBK6957985.1 O-succinylhomoserine sulfhydrylase [Nitrosomonas sp.]MDO8894954.1 O-succinylhomoserine sulfhydrylase [Nitrosomonas sp.]MDO9469813.1 O-succinylhomoserine sulfhydrylase [Nitrosomonas sp.]MDP1550319.1 O-succinylhomoserine sulfhydrylase [Nitrosomonas sp.]MDP1787108.1 O-succinylhomoserine sulfhydrylase [Nitrosomonas sp.]
MSDHLQPETLALHTGIHRSQFNEHSEAMYLTSSFVFDSAAQAAARFSGSEPGNIYARFTNPTVTAFEERLAVLEGAEACIATSSGMSAILACVMGLLSAGDHIVASRSLFGATVNLFNNILKRFNIDTTFVSATDVNSWEAAIQPNTKLFFLETPSNPLTEISDIAELSKISRKAGIWLVVDNCFCTPILQKPLELGADIVIHSATKYLDGQGRVLGGAVLGNQELLMDGGIYGFLRTAGPTLSAFNAWVILKGLETLKIRVEAHAENALKMARWLESKSNVTRVFYPGLMSHPQYELAKCQQKSGGGIVTFEVKGGKEAAWRVIDSTRLISITANLGDAKSTLTHPATTTHARISQEARDAAGISDGLLRIAVGLEAVQDLQDDLARGLS